MAKADYLELTSQKILEKAFSGWEFAGFTFPKPGVADGLVGEKCISKAVQYFLRRQTAGSWQSTGDDIIGLLSGHIYFTAECGVIKNSTSQFTIKLSKFHLTMRRSKCQVSIDNNGSSIITSKESIHINRNTNWGRTENIDALVAGLGNDIQHDRPFTRDEVLDFLTLYRKYTSQYMATLSDELVAEVKKHLTTQLSPIVVTVDSDESIRGH